MLAVILLAANAWAAIEALRFDSADQETRYRALINELRCLVCQNQSLADSNAPLAADLRKITYDMIVAGHSDNDVRDYMSDRYGDFVLYKPPLTATTLVLWAGPFLLLFAVFGILVISIRRRNRERRKVEHDPAALKNAQDLLNTAGPDEG